MKSHQMTEQVAFWRWTSPNSIAMVTPTCVYHWSIEGETAPVKLFDRHANLGAGTQIINYQVSGDGKWSLLIGISQGANQQIVGTMQLYSHEKKVSQVLQGHSGSFCTIQPKGRTDKAQVLVFAGKKDPAQPHQLFIMEVGRAKDAPGGPVFRLPPAAIP